MSRIATIALIVAIGVAAVAFVYFDQEPAQSSSTAPQSVTSKQQEGYTFERLDNPARTVVRNGTAVAATMTDGARTVVITGASRTFGEPKPPKPKSRPTPGYAWRRNHGVKATNKPPGSSHG
ncbi:hypothetical protein [Kibdelosporangium philippinense]|uniref:hypothetical protein n=1 Tax=Kibdelosporangium philippinense TaxID=211113 RepID=UPI00361747B2